MKYKIGDEIFQLNIDREKGGNLIKAIYKGYIIVHLLGSGEAEPYRVILKNEVEWFENIKEAKEYIDSYESRNYSRLITYID